MKDLPVIGLSFGPFCMVIGALNPQGWYIGVGFAGSVMLSLALVSLYRTVRSIQNITTDREK